MNRSVGIILFFFTALSITDSTAQSLVINEIEYANRTVLFDFNGDTPDWFEIFNAGNEILNLGDYKVTDDTSKTDFWIFPDYELKPDSFLVVFASGKNRKGNSEIHTDFKLGLMKDPLYLIGPDGCIVDEIQPICVPPDYSLGHKPDGTGDLTIIAPTPGNSNNDAITITTNYQPDTLMVNYQSGFYEKPLEIKFSNLIAGNKIVYTLNGDLPDDESPVYRESIFIKDLTPEENRFAQIHESDIKPGHAIFKANIVRARIFSEGCPASNEIIHTYFISENIKGKYQVPVISLITEKKNLFDDETGIYVSGNHNNSRQHGKEWERPVHIELFDSYGNTLFSQDGGIRIHGGSSRTAPQKSFRLYSRSEYGKEYFEYPFFRQKPTFSEFKTLVLRAAGTKSGALFKDELCQYMVQDMNIDNTAFETVITFLNGEYWGIYSLRERQDTYYIENNYDIENTKADIIGHYMETILVEDGTVDDYHDLIGFIKNTKPESPDYYKEFGSRIDIDGLIDYYIAQFFLANTDFPQTNLKLWKPDRDTSRWRYFFYDLDATLRTVNDDHLSDYMNHIDDYPKPFDHTTFILRNSINNDEFRQQFYCKFKYHLQTTFEIGTVLDQINYFEKMYQPLVPEHIYRWHIPHDYKMWQNEVQAIKTFAIQRPLAITEQLHKNFGSPFIVWPNPSEGNFYIKFLGSVKFVNIRIVDDRGMLLLQEKNVLVYDNQIQISVDLKSGLYLLQILMNHTMYTGKLIIL